jgi:hypothetical protein
MIRHCAFPDVGSSGANSRCLHCTWPLTQLIWRFIWWCVGSSSAEGLLAKTLLLSSSWPSDEPLPGPSIHPVLLVQSWHISDLFKLGHRIDWWCPPNGLSVHPMLPSLLLVFSQSSGATSKWTVRSSDSTCSLETSRNVPITPTIAPTLLPMYRQFIRWCSFSSTVLTLEKINYLLIWHVVFLHPWNL